MCSKAAFLPARITFQDYGSPSGSQCHDGRWGVQQMDKCISVVSLWGHTAETQSG